MRRKQSKRPVRPSFDWINSNDREHIGKVREGLQELEALARDKPSIVGEILGFPTFDERGDLLPAKQLENSYEKWAISLWALCWRAEHQGGAHPARLIIRKSFSWRFPMEKLRVLTDLRHLNILASILYPEEWKGLSTLSQIETVEMRDNCLFHVPDAIAGLTQLRELKVISWDLKTLPETFASLTNLRHLTVKCNGEALKEFPKGVTELEKLEALALSESQIAVIPSSIGQLKRLQTLQISGYFEDLAWATELDGLQSLRVGSRMVTALPKGFATLTKLTDLALHCSIKTLPSSFGQLDQLRSLSLAKNGLTDLPGSFAQLKQLEELTLHGNSFKQIPEPLFALKSLKRLTFPGASIQESEQQRLEEALPQTKILWDVDERERDKSLEEFEYWD